MCDRTTLVNGAVRKWWASRKAGAEDQESINDERSNGRDEKRDDSFMQDLFSGRKEDAWEDPKVVAVRHMQVAKRNARDQKRREDPRKARCRNRSSSI